eukprot:scaffold153808_cov19-Tisochrysis_lutea.AAC.1
MHAKSCESLNFAASGFRLHFQHQTRSTQAQHLFSCAPPPSGSKLQLFYSAASQVVALSRLVYRKGIDLIALVIPYICATHPNVDFIIGEHYRVTDACPSQKLYLKTHGFSSINLCQFN